MLLFFFFNDTATTEIYTLSLHDALPISPWLQVGRRRPALERRGRVSAGMLGRLHRSEEHTSELQSHLNLVCRLLLEKKKSRPTNRSRNPSLGHTATREPRRLSHVPFLFT